MRHRITARAALLLASLMLLLSFVLFRPAGPVAAATPTPQPAPSNFIGSFNGTTIAFDWAAPAVETAARTGYTLTGYDIETNLAVAGSPFALGPTAAHADLPGLPTNTIYAFRLTATYAAPDTGLATPLLYVVGPTATAIAGDVNQAPGGLVLTQVCGDYGALPSRAPTAGFPVLLPAADAVSGQGIAPTVGGISDPNYPYYPYPPGSTVPTTSTVPPTTVTPTTVAGSSTTVAASSTTATTVAASSTTTPVASTTTPAASSTAVPTTVSASSTSTSAAAASSTAVPASTSTTVASSAVPSTTASASSIPVSPGTSIPSTPITVASVPGVSPTPTSCGIQMGTGTQITDGDLAGQYFWLSGRMNQVTVVDLRPIPSGWTLNGVMGTVTHALGGPNQSFTGDHVGWDPLVTSQAAVPAGANMGVVPGSVVDPMRPGLAVMQPLASAPTGSGTGVAVIDARLNMLMPLWVSSGDYHGTLTLTLI